VEVAEHLIVASGRRIDCTINIFHSIPITPTTSCSGTTPPSNGVTKVTVCWSLGYLVKCPMPVVSAAKSSPLLPQQATVPCFYPVAT
jgi:hypothetical protein